MAYRDNPFDYQWQILSLSVDQRFMTVKYDTTDSADSYPSVFRRFSVPVDYFTESDLTVLATEKFVEEQIVRTWDEIDEANSANPTFDPTTLIGNVYSGRYKVHSYDNDSFTSRWNDMTHKGIPYDVEDSDTVTTYYNIVPLDSDEKVAARNNLTVNRRYVWTLLDSEGHRDSFISMYGLNDSFDAWLPQSLDFLSADVGKFGQGFVKVAQDLLEWDDSTMAEWILSV